MGLAVVLLAGAVAAGVAGFRILAHSLSHGQIGSLVAGLAIGAAVLAAAGLAAWLILLLMQNDGPSSERSFRLRRRVILCFLIVVAEIGLAWLLIESAERHHSGAAWITGPLALVISGLVVPIWTISGVDVDEELLTVSLPPVLAEASLGLLTVGFAGGHSLVVAWLLAGLAIAESVGWMVLPVPVSTSSRTKLDWTIFPTVLAIPPLSVVGAIIKFAVDGKAIAALVTGVVGLAALLVVLWRFDALPDMSGLRPRLGHPARTLPVAAVPVSARLAGLVVPLGTVVWAEISHDHGIGGTAAVRFLSVASWVILAATASLLLQGLAVAWLRPVGPVWLISQAAAEAQERGAPRWEEHGRYESARLDRLDPDERIAREGADRQRHERERGARLFPPERDGPGYAERPRLMREDHLRRSSTLFSRVIRPLGVRPAALSAGLGLAESTGLNVDQVWPQLQLVVPSHVRREVVRKDRMIGALRIAAASAICTAIAWPISAGIILTGASGVVLATLVVAPLAVAVVAVIVARGRLADVYLRRVHTTELYRFDLIKALHLPRARDDAEFALFSRYIADSSRNRPIVWAENVSPERRAEPSYLPETLAREVAVLAEQRIEGLLRSHRELLLQDRAELAEQQREQFRDWLSTQALGPEELARLGDHIADRAAGPVSNGLSREMVQIREEFTRSLRSTLEEVISESVLGPTLTNFTGYVTLELHRASEEDPLIGSADGTIWAGPGHELAFVMSVVREPDAARVASLSKGPDGSFLVLEPLVIEGGRDSRVAEFAAVADCATLTPLPRRRNLDVAERASVPFRFKLPGRHGPHELWFQLYQAGRLIQAVAVLVEVRPGQMAAT
jgi:hypothetical protein